MKMKSALACFSVVQDTILQNNNLSSWYTPYIDEVIEEAILNGVTNNLEGNAKDNGIPIHILEKVLKQIETSLDSDNRTTNQSQPITLEGDRVVG